MGSMKKSPVNVEALSLIVLLILLLAFTYGMIIHGSMTGNMYLSNGGYRISNNANKSRTAKALY